MSIDINKVLGETNEYGGKRTVVPASYYPMVLAIGEPGVTDLKTDKDGNITGGGTPQIPVTGSIYAGPFEGIEVQTRLYPTPGKKGGGFGIFFGATSAVTGQSADLVSALKKVGIVLPTQGAADAKTYQELVRAHIKDSFDALDPDKRLAVVLEAFRFAQWQGKRAIIKVDVETSYFRKVGDSNVRLYDQPGNTAAQQYAEILSNEGAEAGSFRDDNRFNGYYSLTATTKGMGYVEAIEFPKQERVYAEMKAAGLL